MPHGDPPATTSGALVGANSIEAFALWSLDGFRTADLLFMQHPQEARDTDQSIPRRWEVNCLSPNWASAIVEGHPMNAA